MGMTPFEVRLEVLKMAKELAMEKHYDKRSTQSERVANWNEENGTTATVEDLQVPTAADIIKQAEELNKFVSEAPSHGKKELLSE